MKATRKEVCDWFALLAQTTLLQDCLRVLEIERVLDATDSSIEARRWASAAADLRDAAVERCTDQLETVRWFGDAAGNRVLGATRSLRAAARSRESRELPRG